MVSKALAAGRGGAAAPRAVVQVRGDPAHVSQPGVDAALQNKHHPFLLDHRRCLLRRLL